MVCMYGMHKALKHDLDGSGSELPWPLNIAGRINTIDITVKKNITASRDYVEASANRDN